METNDQPKVTRVCALDGCNREFTPTDNKNIYCCNSHRAMASARRKKARKSVGEVQDIDIDTQDAAQPTAQPSASIFPEPKERREVAVPADALTPTGLFIIEQLKADRDYYKEEYRDERNERKKLNDKYQALEKEYDQFKRDVELEEAKKPSKLGAIMEGFNLKDLMPHIGPAAGEMLMGFAKMATAKMGGMAPAAPGLSGLSGLSADIMSLMAAWLPQQDEETQQLFLQMMQPVMQTDAQTVKTFFTNVITFMQQSNRRSQPDYNYGT